MTNTIKYTNIKEILSRLLRNKKLQDLTLEAVAQYTIDFMGVFGLPDMYEDKETIVSIQNFRGVLPCDLISVNQVMDTHTNTCLRSMTDTFYPTNKNSRMYSDFTYKTKNRIIFTSFDKGEVKVNYKSIPVDEDGFPMIIDNSPYLRALEAFIKKEVFINMFDNGEISQQVLQNAKQEYAWRAGQLNSEFNLPSDSEMKSITNSWCTLIQRTNNFNDGWKNLGTQEYLIKH